MYLLDTNVVSELRKGEGANTGVMAWAQGQPERQLYLSVVSVHELELGVCLKERSDPPQGRVLRRWLDEQVVPAFDDRVLPVTEAIARRSAALHVPDPRPTRDAFIAATALVHQLVVVTRNVSDFEPTGVQWFNPWS